MYLGDQPKQHLCAGKHCCSALFLFLFIMKAHKKMGVELTETVNL